MRRTSGLLSLVLGMAVTVGCRTSGSAVKGAEEMSSAAPFCVGPRGLDDVRAQSFGFSKWAEVFKQGRATPDLIPSIDRPGAFYPGQGFPKIVFLNMANEAAAKIWGGKTMVTDEQGNTKLINRFLQAGEDTSLDLFTASVRIDPASKWSQQDGKPVILLDYTRSQLNSQSSAQSAFVPVIKAIRDEVRLVCETVDGNVRRRLYLGPTFLLPEEFATIDLIGRGIARLYEHEPILWFALEFTDEI